MTPWHDCAPSHSRPDGAVVAGSTHRATHRPRQLAPTRSARDTSCLPLIDPAPMAARPPSSCQCGCLTPPSSPSIGIWPGPFAFPYPSSLVSTTGRPRFGGFGLRMYWSGIGRSRRTDQAGEEPIKKAPATLGPFSFLTGSLARLGYVTSKIQRAISKVYPGGTPSPKIVSWPSSTSVSSSPTR